LLTVSSWSSFVDNISGAALSYWAKRYDSAICCSNVSIFLNMLLQQIA